MGIESRCGEIFRTCPDQPPEPTQSPVKWIKGFFYGVNEPWRGVNHPPTFKTEVKEGHLPSDPSWQVIR